MKLCNINANCGVNILCYSVLSGCKSKKKDYPEG
jgi:hypothetical protein